MRDLVTWNGYPAPVRHECPLPTGVCKFDFPFLKKVYCFSSYDLTSNIDASHLFHGLAHAPNLDDLAISCTNLRSEPLVSPVVALKRYAFHHWDPGGNVTLSESSGWSRPLSSSLASLQSFELTIRDQNELIECDFTSMLSRGVSFPQLEILSLSMSFDHRFDSFIPLLVLCPRVQDLTISVDAHGQPFLPPFGRLINMLPNSVALKRLTIGLRMWNIYYQLMAPSILENESFDRSLAILIRSFSVQALRSFRVVTNNELLQAFEFSRVSEACRSRRITFGVEGHPSPGMTVWEMPLL